MVETVVKANDMDGAIDIRLIVTLGGILFSVAGAAAIARHQIKSLIEKLHDIEGRLRSLDKVTDTQEVSVQNHAQRLKLEKDVDNLKSMHNGSHPNTRGSG